MATEDGKPTAGDDAGKKDDAEHRPADESYTKIRIKRALEKQAPAFAAQGRRSLLEELGLDADDESTVDTLKATLAKGASADSELTRLQKQLVKVQQEREEVAARAITLERSISARAVHDTIASAIGDAAIVPGTLPEIQKLLSERFVVADGKVAVLGDDGEPANIAPKKLVGEWLASHTHYLTAAAPKGGAGSRQSSGEPRDGNSKPKLKTDEERRIFFEQKLREGPPRS